MLLNANNFDGKRGRLDSLEDAIREALISLNVCSNTSNDQIPPTIYLIRYLLSNQIPLAICLIRDFNAATAEKGLKPNAEAWNRFPQSELILAPVTTSRAIPCETQ